MTERTELYEAEEIDQDLPESTEIDQDEDDDAPEGENAEQKATRKLKQQRRFSEKTLRKKLTSMLARTAVMAEAGLDDGSMSIKDAAKTIKDMADTCNKINGSPTAKIQMGTATATGRPDGRALQGKDAPQMNLEAELEAVRNAGNSPT